MINRILQLVENFILAIGRWVLNISAVLIIVVGVFGTLYLGLVYLTASPDNIDRPEIETTFDEPERNPVEAADRKRRISEAKESFDSKMQDAYTQIDLTSGNARNRDREIRSDYAELIRKPENKEDLGKLSELAAFRDNSVSDNCDEKSRQIEAIIFGIEDDLLSIAQIHNVTSDEISTGHAANLERSVRLPKSCTVLSNNVAAISKILRETFPADWGLSGTETKEKISEEVARNARELEQYTDEEFANDAMNKLVNYVESLRDYYVPVTRQLDDRNELTNETVKIIGDDISISYYDYLDSVYEEWDDYLVSIRTASDESQERLAWATALLASSGIFWAVALSILILLAFFAMERHQRYLKLLEDKEKQL
tara:strand:+ start:73 stop:1182 length:1110 start_codon:yes stop_codon:yes gene_type:complete